jgi:hypothetical protein
MTEFSASTRCSPGGQVRAILGRPQAVRPRFAGGAPPGPRLRCRTPNRPGHQYSGWGRGTRISTSLAPSERASSTIQPTRRERIRYVSLSATRRSCRPGVRRETCRSRSVAEFRAPTSPVGSRAPRRSWRRLGSIRRADRATGSGLYQRSLVSANHGDKPPDHQQQGQHVIPRQVACNPSPGLIKKVTGQREPCIRWEDAIGEASSCPLKWTRRLLKISTAWHRQVAIGNQLPVLICLGQAIH